MTRIALIALLAAAAAPLTAGAAFAQSGTQAGLPPAADRIAMLGDYAQALGHRFGCNGNQTQMVDDIKKFTYGLQLNEQTSAQATDTVKSRLTAGITEAKSNPKICPGADAEVSALEGKLKQQRPLMEEASKTVTAMGGAALACGVDPAQVKALDQNFWTYAKTDGADYGARHTAWEQEGAAEVTKKAIGCDQVKEIFAGIQDMFKS